MNLKSISFKKALEQYVEISEPVPIDALGGLEMRFRRLSIPDQKTIDKLNRTLPVKRANSQRIKTDDFGKVIDDKQKLYFIKCPISDDLKVDITLDNGKVEEKLIFPENPADYEIQTAYYHALKKNGQFDVIREVATKAENFKDTSEVGEE
jgi:hypothetical protein